jgi:acyl-coenzyme A synthetase/AMP-(fatty) acid ligase
VLGERVHAFISLKPGHLASAALESELKAHCAVCLSDYKVPESFSVSAQPLPRNANGKLLKRVLREQLAAASPPPAPASAPAPVLHSTSRSL